MARLVLEFNRDDLSKMGYPVVVEMYDKVTDRDGSMKIKRAYREAFTEYERRKISKVYYPLFYKWYLKTGVPATFVWPSLKEMEFAQKVINFFGTV